MGLLSRKPALSEIECQRENLLHRKAALEAQRVAAERRLDEAVANRRTQLLESDLDNGQSAKNIVGRLRDEKDAITDALAAIDLKLTDVEQRLRQDADRSAREKASERCQEQIAAARLVADRFATALEEATTVMQGLTNLSLTANTTASSLKIFGDQLRLGIAQGIAESENYRVRMLAGNVPVVGEAKPVVTVPVPPAPVVARRLIYLHENAKWIENGVTRTAGKWSQANPPEEFAAKAISLGVADDFHAARAEKLREIHGMPFSFPHPSQCVCLETGQWPAPDNGEETAAAAIEYVGAPTVGLVTLR
jgi:hypothetical protein